MVVSILASLRVRLQIAGLIALMLMMRELSLGPVGGDAGDTKTPFFVVTGMLGMQTVDAEGACGELCSIGESHRVQKN